MLQRNSMLIYRTRKNITNKKFLDLIKRNPNLEESKMTKEEKRELTKIKEERRELPYLKSLFYKKRTPTDPVFEDMLKVRAESYNEMVYNPAMILKNLSKTEKDKINLLIDIKMQELEDSGLTRSQLSGLESNHN
jgi:hypothetical protein